MRSAAKLITAASLVLVSWLPVQADVFKPSSVPADTQWVMHVDMDALGKSTFWTMFIGPAAQDPNATRRADMFKKLQTDIGLNLPQDIHDATLYGNGFAKDSSSMLVHGEFDAEKIVAKLKTLPGYASQTYNGHTIHTATMPHQNQDGAGFMVIEGKTAILSNNETQVKAALDLLDGKGKSLDVTSPFVAGDQQGVLIYLGAQGLANLPAEVSPQSPMLKRLKTGWTAIGQSADGSQLTIKTMVVGQTNDDAAQINTMLQGMKAAMIMSQATTQPAGGVSMKPVLDSLMISLNADTVTASMAVPFTWIQQMQAAHKGGHNNQQGIHVEVKTEVKETDGADTQPSAK